ncbi:MAG TPA: hypothetical protein VJ482_02650 [Acidimicrobiia bacterium]|nr:hypothetical protein [Acidimicrobiia bacterium]
MQAAEGGLGFMLDMAVAHRVSARDCAVDGATGTGATDPTTYALLVGERPVMLLSARFSRLI